VTDAAVERAAKWLNAARKFHYQDSPEQMLADFAAEENKALQEALQKLVAAKFLEVCHHDEEPWYCVCCQSEWEAAIVDARKSAEAALADELEAEREG
jgi:hypothetical protein